MKTDNCLFEDGYGLMSKLALTDKRFTWQEKAVFNFIIMMIGKNDKCWPSNNYIADQLGMTPSYISKTINKYKVNGYFKVNYIFNGKMCQRRYISINFKELKKYRGQLEKENAKTLKTVEKPDETDDFYNKPENYCQVLPPKKEQQKIDIDDINTVKVNNIDIVDTNNIVEENKTGIVNTKKQYCSGNKSSIIHTNKYKSNNIINNKNKHSNNNTKELRGNKKIDFKGENEFAYGSALTKEREVFRLFEKTNPELKEMWKEYYYGVQQVMAHPLVNFEKIKQALQNLENSTYFKNNFPQIIDFFYIFDVEHNFQAAPLRIAKYAKMKKRSFDIPKQIKPEISQKEYIKKQVEKRLKGVQNG